MPIGENVGKAKPEKEPLPKLLFGPEDGWHYVPNHPQEHYFFKGASMCRKYPKKPDGAYHCNTELIHCTKCTQQIRKLLGLQEYLAGKELTAKQVFVLLEIIEKMKLNKGIIAKELTPESTVAVLGHPDGTKETFEAGEITRKKKKSA